MTEALMKTVLDFGKNTLNLKTIEAFTHKNNQRFYFFIRKTSILTLGDDDLFGDNRVFRSQYKPRIM